MGKQEWRMVNGQAILCSGCRMNQNQGGIDICAAPDEECVFLKKKIDGQKTWESFKDAYKETAK